LWQFQRAPKETERSRADIGKLKMRDIGRFIHRYRDSGEIQGNPGTVEGDRLGFGVESLCREDILSRKIYSDQPFDMGRTIRSTVTFNKATINLIFVTRFIEAFVFDKKKILHPQK
jgi:hypothetical protein